MSRHRWRNLHRGTESSQQQRRSSVLRIARRRLWRGGRVVGLAVVSVLVTVCVAVFALSATGVARFVPVLSNSMAPQMSVGSVALTLPVPRSAVRVGDVIVFTDPQRPSIRVIHRVTHVYGADEAHKFADWSTKRLFVDTRGDNNPSADPWVVSISDASIWRRVGSMPGIGYPAIWINSPTLRLAVFLFAGAAIALWALYLIWRKPRGRDSRSVRAPSGAPGRRRATEAAGELTSS